MRFVCGSDQGQRDCDKVWTCVGLVWERNSAEERTVMEGEGGLAGNENGCVSKGAVCDVRT